MGRVRTGARRIAPSRSFRLLLAQDPVVMDETGRVEMTAACHDCDDIPKVPGAGTVETSAIGRFQLMHNGVRVLADGYYGPWMTSLIERLRGHHEPQEERVFHEVLKHLPDSATMLELGSYWAYYSLWFKRAVPGGLAICCEPDPVNLAVGRENARANGCDITFIDGAVGRVHGGVSTFVPEGGERPPLSVRRLSVDGLIEELGLDRLDVLHLDVQGAELDALDGAALSIQANRIRFVFVSTHHYSYSDDLLTHERCLGVLDEAGAHVIAEHGVHESYSGDGLIVASFDDRDRGLSVELSRNRSSRALFRPYEHDLAILASHIDRDGRERLRSMMGRIRAHGRRYWRR
jgi:FkbM family methyltransferase